MTYNPNIPQPGDLLPNSQPQILANFTELNTDFARNHIALTDATVANRGKHKFTVFPSLTALGIAAPATTATEGALYTKTVGATNRLFWRQQGSGTEIQMTNVDPVIAANGTSFLPGAIIINWGILVNAPSGESAAINFATAFSAVPYSVVVTPLRSATANPTPCFVSSDHVPSNTSFRIVNTSSNPHDVYWLAIGPK